MPLFGKYACYALLALALDLVWGYAGILSLGHGAFFALGGYAMGMYLMRQIGTRGVYQNPILPDFMVFLNWKELPWYWYGFDHFAFAALMVVLVPGLLAFVFGFFAFRSRVNGVYLSIITQALTYALLLAFFRNDMGFGGNNGLTDFKDMLGFPLQHGDTRRGALHRLGGGAGPRLSRCAAIIVTSKLGRVLLAVRDAESRVLFLGYSVDARTSSSSAPSRRCWPASPARSTCRRSASSTRANSRPPTRSRSRSGSRSAAAARWSARSLGAVVDQRRQDLPHRRVPGSSGSISSARLFILVTLFLPKGIVGLAAAGAGAAPRRRRRQARRRKGGAMSVTTVGPELATSLLYLDGVTVSFDGFKALNALSLIIDRGELRCIIGPNGAGKTTMMDVITGKTRPDEGTVLFDGNHRPDAARRGRDRQSRHRPQVPEADRVREPHRVREPRAGAEDRARHRAHAVRAARRRRSATSIDAMLDDASASPGASRCLAGALSPRPEAMARDRHAAHAGPRSCCCSTSRSRA